MVRRLAGEVHSASEILMQYLVIESFRDRDAVPVYRRFRERGRLAPPGLHYLASWVTADLCRCYQIMECADPILLELWMDQWRDLVDFEVHPVISSGDVLTRLADRL